MTVEVCSKCKVNPPRSEDQRYCAECHRKYLREYRRKTRDDNQRVGDRQYNDTAMPPKGIVTR